MKRTEGKIALAQIFILVISLFAFSYLIGSTGFVSATVPADGPTSDPPVATTPVDPYNHYYLCDQEGDEGCVDIPKDAIDPNTKTVDPEKAGEEATKFLEKVGGAIVTQATLTVLGWAKETLFPVSSTGGAVDAISGAAPIATGEPFKFSFYLFGEGVKGQPATYFFTEVAKGASWWNYAAVTLLYTFGVAAAVTAVAAALGASGRNVKNIGIFAFSTATAAYVSSLVAAGAGTGPVGWVLASAILLLTGGWTLLTYKLYSQEVFTFIPSVWQPEKGGAHCEECNSLEVAGKNACSEYRCQTLGKDCKFEEGSCFEANPNDIVPPTITPLESVLPNENYAYDPSNVEYPSDTGVKIVYSGNDVTKTGCVPAFSSLTIGVETNEFATCKVDIEKRDSFDKMISLMTRGENIYEHYLFLPNSATPSVESLYGAGWNVSAGTQREFYIRCEDSQGNSGVTNFIVQFCIDDGPDTSPPEIIGTNYQQETFIQNRITSINNFQVYTNEPAECKWDYNDVNYDTMTNEFESCSENLGEYLTGFKYGCQGTIDGLKDSVDNKIYIRCKDKPGWIEGDSGSRFTNTESYLQTLKGTQPLVIDKISINGQTDNIVIEDSTNSVKATIEVKTLAGADTGKAKCNYKEIRSTQYNNFYNNGKFDFVYPNTQDLFLSEDDYSFDIRCEDAGGNVAEGAVEFEVQTDTEAPNVVRAYHESTYLKIVTDEEAQCVYDAVNCNYDFDDGYEMASTDSINHFTNWNTQTNFYIKCKDDWGNWPLPNECSIIVKPSRI